MKSFTKTLLVCLLFVCSLQPFSPMVSAQGAGWLTGWDYRQGLTITNSSGAGTDYQVNTTITYDSEMQVDFDDIRFTDDDGSTLLDYWLESKIDSTSAEVWVKVADNLTSTQVIYMYYGNDAVSTTSSGADTFEFYEDWTTEAIGAQWTIENTDGSVSFNAAGATHGSIIKVEGNDGAFVYSFYSDSDYNSSYALRFRSNTEKTVGASQSTKQGWSDADANGYAMIESYQGAARIVIRDDAAVTDHQNIADSNYDAWHIFDSTRDGTNTQWTTDGVEVAEGDNSPDALAYNVYVYVRDSEYDTYNDWFVVRKWIVSEPVVALGIWNTVNSIEFFLHVGWDANTQFGFDMLFIVLGLIMIPASTMYLVRGGRKEMSTDKVFLGLLLLFMGIGLVIGGVTP